MSGSIFLARCSAGQAALRLPVRQWIQATSVHRPAVYYLTVFMHHWADPHTVPPVSYR